MYFDKLYSNKLGCTQTDIIMYEVNLFCYGKDRQATLSSAKKSQRSPKIILSDWKMSIKISQEVKFPVKFCKNPPKHLRRILDKSKENSCSIRFKSQQNNPSKTSQEDSR